METKVTIPARYNGPPHSGNGGYSCGVVAAYIAGPARIRLHVPPPLDVPMRIVAHVDGSVEMFDGDALVGSGGPIHYTPDIPVSPGLEVAKDAMSRYVARDEHMFSTCYVCGPQRPACDGLELFPGPIVKSPVVDNSEVNWNLLACVWQPKEDMLDDDGCIRAEVMWAALDCPGFFAAMGETLRPAVLGQLEGELKRRVEGQESLVVYSWPMGSEGRKYYGGAAIATAQGEVVASSFSTWIELKNM